MLALPPPLWGLLFLTALYFLSDLPVFRGLPMWQHKPIGVILIVAGFLLPAIAITQFRMAGTQVKPTSKTNAKLVTSGLYGLTRNPMYLGLTIMAFGGALWFGRPLMFLAPLLLLVVANWMFIPFEEAKMRRQFGEQFDAYTKRVRRWI